MKRKVTLAEQQCISCEGGLPAFGKTQIQRYLPKLKKGWTALGSKKLVKIFLFKNFVQTMGFVNQVALLAQADNHHPDLHVSYSKVVVELWTHASSGITENDFVLAAKIDQIK